MIPADHKLLILNSLERLECQPIDLMEAFYDRLFDISPRAETLFKGNMSVQYEKLLDMLMLVMHSLDNLNQLVVTLEELGARHLTYGVAPSDYDAVGQSLIHALSHNITDWTDAETEAWASLYGFMSDLMITGAADYMDKAG